jgi:hypothetical protein
MPCSTSCTCQRQSKPTSAVTVPMVAVGDAGALRADGARSSGKSSAPSKNFRRGNSRLSLRLSSQQYAENDSYVTGQIMSSSALTGEPFSRGSYFSYPAHSPGSHTGVFRLSTSPPVVRPTQPSTSVPQAASNLDEHTGGGSTAPHAAGQTTATAVGPAAGMLPGGDTVQPACRLLPVFMRWVGCGCLVVAACITATGVLDTPLTAV